MKVILMEQQKKYHIVDYLLFMLPSLLGVVFFLIPFPFSSGYDLPIGYFAKNLLSLLGEKTSILILVSIALASFFSLYSIFVSGFHNKQNKFINYFKLSQFWLLVRLLGFIFCFMCFFKVGPEIIWSEKTGTMLFIELMPFLFCIFFCAGFLLPLLLDFGLLEFFGVMLTKVMRPLFTLPGRSSLDCFSSVIGDGSIGILLTNKQYEQGFYTRREAMVIATTFSFVSITFSFVVLSHAKLAHLAFPFYLTIAFAGFVAAVICPRIPPLSRVKDTYYKEPPKLKSSEVKDLSLYSRAIIGALELAKKNASLKKYIMGGFKNVLDMWLGVLPAVMCFGTVSLIIAEYTPFFKYLGFLFYPLLLLLQVPEAYEASQAFVVGFSDMFLPVIITSHIQSDLTRFVIASTSVSQLIFMSEVGALLLSSKIGIRFRDLVVIFFLRTVITLPVVVLCAHFIF